MILFYSNYCNHCTMLLEHIKRYDKDKKIKIVSIDQLRSKNINIDSKIHSIPALMLLPSKEVLFGKSVFDYLLLPGRGILCGEQNTRSDKGVLKTDTYEKDQNEKNNDEPSAFSLSGFSLSDNFSNIDETTDAVKDKNYNWDYISNDNINEKISANNLSNENLLNNNTETKKKLPSLEELMQQREKDITK